MSDRERQPLNESAMPQAFGEVLLLFLLCFIQGGWAPPDVNEVHYLSKAKHYWNPAWLAGDPFLNTADAHTLFYWTFGWLTLWLPLPVVAWVGRVIGWLGIAWSWRRLSLAIVPRAWWSVLSGGLFLTLFYRYHMAGEWVIGGVEAKVFAFTPALLGMAAVARGAWGRAWVWFGLAAALHVLVGGWLVVAAMFALGVLCWQGQARFTDLQPKLLVVGGLISLAGLIPAALLTRGVDAATLAEANRIYVYERLPHHLVPSTIPWNFLFRFSIVICLWTWLAYLGRSERTLRRLTALVNGALAIAAVGLLLTLLAPLDRDRAASLLRFYWFRTADVLLPLGVALAACHTLSVSRRHQLLGLAAAMLFIGWHETNVILRRRANPRPNADDKLLSSTDWREVCHWIDENLPSDARFLTPLLSASFRWYANRAEVATRKDLPQDPRGIVVWWRTLGDLHDRREHPGLTTWRKTYTKAPPAELVRLGQQYQAKYLVTEALPPLPFKLLNPPNPSYAVYELPETWVAEEAPMTKHQ